MAKYGSPSVSITWDGTNITQYVTDINNIDIESILEETHTFGDSWFESTAVGIRKVGDLKLKGFYDDTATVGPNALFVVISTGSPGPADTTKNLVITYGSTKTTTIPCFIQKYSRMLDRGKLHKFEVTLQPSGAPTEA